MALFATEAVYVLRPASTGLDPLRNEVVEWVREEVAGVLVAPGKTSDVDGRPLATSRAWTLHFPASYSASLRGCRVEVRGEAFAVVGDPRPYAAGNVPGEWDRPVEAEAVDG